MAIQAVQVPISYSGVPDRFFWPHSKNEDYNVKTRYHITNKENQKIVAMPSTSLNLGPSNWNKKPSGASKIKNVYVADITKCHFSSR